MWQQQWYVATTVTLACSPDSSYPEPRSSWVSRASLQPASHPHYQRPLSLAPALSNLASDLCWQVVPMASTGTGKPTLAFLPIDWPMAWSESWRPRLVLAEPEGDLSEQCWEFGGGGAGAPEFSNPTSCSLASAVRVSLLTNAHCLWIPILSFIHLRLINLVTFSMASVTTQWVVLLLILEW
jgi:hypothetical protein